MTTIELVANDQLLQVTVNPTISSGEQNTVEVHVDFSDDWDGFSKSAVFYTSYNSRDIYEIVMTNDECIVPSEVMTKSGTLYIGIRGVNSEKNEVKTTSLVKLKISEGAPTGNSTGVEPTPDVYQQLLTAYGKTDNSINKEKAERQAEIAVERARIDNMSTLAEGSTTADAELLDIRVKADGSTATSAGNAVREQVSELKSDLADLQKTVGAEINVSKDFEWIKGQWANGVFADNGPKGTYTHSTKNKYQVPKGTVFISNSTWVCYLGLYDSDLTFLETITISDGYVFEEDAYVTLGITKANKTTFTEADRLLAVKENRFCIPEKNLSKEVTDLKEQGIGGGSSIPQEQKSNFANAIRNEIAFTSTSHPYADAFLAWLESGSDTPVTPPYADISASFSGGVLTISSVPTITNKSFTNGILSLS